MEHNKIRNFAIIAHIDHGKSTLTDRLLEVTGTVAKRNMRAQYLDTMDLEQEKGITIKSQSARMSYKGYQLNLIDTPGHVDFSYEVSRSLAACEGVVLVVDATQGMQAQTYANLYLAMDSDLEIVTFLNKADLAGADIGKVATEVETFLGEDPEEMITGSAKTGEGAVELLEAIIEKIPPPRKVESQFTRGLIFDSHYDDYRGVVVHVKITEGELHRDQKAILMSNETEVSIMEVGYFSPDLKATDSIVAGEVGYIITNLKNIRDFMVGDTITLLDNPAKEPLSGFKKMKPMVFSGIYPENPDEFKNLREAIEKLVLTDSALVYETETSNALGYGFRCGFLGMLHMEIIQERIEREYGISVVATVPNVVFKVELRTGEKLTMEKPSELPDTTKIKTIYEPFIEATIITPDEYVGSVMEVVQKRRGIYKKMTYLSTEKVELIYEIPLSSILIDFYSKLKSVSRGYASLDYEFDGYKESNLVRVDIWINGKPVDALSFLTNRDDATYKGREVVTELRKNIPKHMFEIAIQAVIGRKIIARETVRAMRKDVTAKCYGGDITRKRKLLEKQAEGKKRMKQVGSVNIPQTAFFSVLRINNG